MNAVRRGRVKSEYDLRGSDVSPSDEHAVGAWLDFYNDVPSFEMSLDEFEEYALARLKVLRKIEELKTRNCRGDRYKSMLDDTIKANLRPDPSAAASSSAPRSSAAAALAADAFRKRDAASHYILRAAYCRTEELRRWFLSQESALFRHRLDDLLSSSSSSSRALRSFLKRSGIALNEIDPNEKERLRNHLLSAPGISPGTFASATYYAVPFTEALDLVASRGCHVRGGCAYVPQSKIVTIVCAKFRTSLSKSLARASGSFDDVVSYESDRIGPLLRSMNSQYTGKNRYDESSKSTAGLNADNVDDHVRNMPLCMSRLHAGLRADHKLKYWGRQQYGLFLKGAGLSLEESLTFFQREFTKIMTSDKFNKEYAYSIRHRYGKEGGRKNYTPYNCTKIVLGQPPQTREEHHGCPYRHYDESHLSSLLTKLKIGSPADRDVILSHKRNKNYQLACAKHFEAAHPNATTTKDVNLNDVGNHPNAWFAASVSYRRAKEGGGGAEEGSQEEEGTQGPTSQDLTQKMEVTGGGGGGST